MCKRDCSPVVHSQIYVGSKCNALTNGENDNLSKVEALVKCKILPPPSWYVDETAIERYLLEYGQSEGIRPESNRVEKNAGLRAIEFTKNAGWPSSV